MEWSTSTIVTIGVVAIAHIIEAVCFVWYISGRLTRIETNSQSNGVEISKVDAALEKHCELFDEHVQDARVHTTEEQRRDIGRRLEKLEDAVASGYRDLSNELSTWASRILSK